MKAMNHVRRAAILMLMMPLWSCGGLLPDLRPDGMTRQRPEPIVESGRPEFQEVSSDGSLWNPNGYRNLFRDLRARQVGDLVTVNISESSKASKKADTKTSRDSSIQAGISNALGWEGKIKNLTSLGKSKVRKAFDNETMFKASMKNEFDGAGETTRDETMNASITARVTEVTPEGNLFIRGTREVKVNNETQYITLTGMIRPEDVSPDNTILSSYIADAKIAYSGKGSVSDKQRPGWLMRAVDFVWPF
ncbi:MAG: flagellar basal body L-ring protein FlgH [Thermodesulfobacteriota bacterium]